MPLKHNCSRLGRLCKERCIAANLSNRRWRDTQATTPKFRKYLCVCEGLVSWKKLVGPRRKERCALSFSAGTRQCRDFPLSQPFTPKMFRFSRCSVPRSQTFSSIHQSTISTYLMGADTADIDRVLD